MRFQVISDIHLEFGRDIKLTCNAPFLLLAGDIGNPCKKAYSKFIERAATKFEHVFIIVGNHEYYQPRNIPMQSVAATVATICAQFDNVHFLDNSYYDLEGLRIIGSTLWSNIHKNAPDINDQKCVYTSVGMQATRKDIISLHHQAVEFISTAIANSDLPVLVLTHHLPSYALILPEYKRQFENYNSHFASDLNAIIKAPVVAWVCGHSHGFNHQVINDVNCYMNAYGYPGEQRRGATLDFTFEINI